MAVTRLSSAMLGAGISQRWRRSGCGLMRWYAMYNHPPRDLAVLNLPDYVEEDDSFVHASMSDDVIPRVCEFHKDAIVRTVYEGMPISHYHLLILPRGEYVEDAGELRRKHLPLLQHMAFRARDIANFIGTHKDPQAAFRAGFHLAPRRKQLHLQLFSTDFSLLHHGKMHYHRYNAFASRYLIDIEDVIESVSKYGRLRVSELSLLNYMVQQPRCPRCGYTEITQSTFKMLEHVRHCNVMPSQGNFFRLRL